jgi:hypothetical protein
MDHHDYTGLLYASPSFVEGLARAVDIGGTFDEYNSATSPSEADEAALASDWYAVGADLYHAISQFEGRAGSPSSHGRRAESR